MNPILSFVLRVFVSIPLTVVFWLISFFGFDLSFLPSLGISILAVLFLNWIASMIFTHRYLRKQGLSRKEYRYIKEHLNEGRKKMIRLHKAMLSIRHMPSLKDRIEFLKVTKKIYTLTRKEPKRFYLAEPFYYSHLDSALELAEKYVFLSRQPKRTRELDQSLSDALYTLEDVKKTVEDDLYKVISNDIETLDFEIDVAKHSIKNHDN
jgi:5-bromo-4-chloroindolyl phosphate hydrolysis protein